MLVTTISWEVASPAAFLAVWENGKLPGTKKRVYGKMTYFCGIHAIILQRKSNPRFRSHEKTTNARQSRNPEFHHSREQPPHILTTVRPSARPYYCPTSACPHYCPTRNRGSVSGISIMASYPMLADATVDAFPCFRNALVKLKRIAALFRF